MQNGRTIFSIAFLIDTASLFLLLAAIYFVFIRRKVEKRKVLPDSEQDSAWNFGDEWKNSNETLDLSEWEEIITIPEGYSRIYDRAVPIMRRETIDINELQTTLTENQIASKIARSKKTSTTPADGLFVEKKFAVEARRILNIDV